MPANGQVSSTVFWLSALVAAGLDLAWLALLAWRIPPARFRALRWPLAGAAALFWGTMGAALVSVFWDSYYRYFFPGWARSGAAWLAVALIYAGLTLAFHWLALRAPLHPLLAFCALGGLESALEHLWGLYGLNILDVPMLQGASAASVLAFAVPEYIFYWCLIISLALLAQGTWAWLKRGASSE